MNNVDSFSHNFYVIVGFDVELVNLHHQAYSGGILALWSCFIPIPMDFPAYNSLGFEPYWLPPTWLSLIKK